MRKCSWISSLRVATGGGVFEEAADVMAVRRGRIRLKKSMAEGVPEVALHTALGRDSVIGR